MLEVRVRRTLPNLDLDVALITDDGIVVLFGPSGSGKSMTLRMIAGIASADAGFIRVRDRVLLDSDAGICLPPQQRRIGYVPQNYALFPHLTALENVAMPLCKGLRWPRAKAMAQAQELLATFGLTAQAPQHPARLSGGQQQRVALARAIAIEPDVLLLDEPFSALDTPTRLELRDELRRLHQRARIPILFVTHDLEEAVSLGDSMAVLIDGHVRQHDRVRRVLDAPHDRDVADLAQARNVIPGRCQLGEGACWVETGFGRVRAAVCHQAHGEAVFAVIRPDLIRLLPASVDGVSAATVVRGRVSGLVDHGHWVAVLVDVANDRIEVSQSQHDVQRHGLAVGVAVTVAIPAESVHVIPRHQSG